MANVGKCWESFQLIETPTMCLQMVSDYSRDCWSRFGVNFEGSEIGRSWAQGRGYSPPLSWCQLYPPPPRRTGHCALVSSPMLCVLDHVRQNGKGLESCLVWARPRFQAQQYGGRHGSQRVSSNWHFTNSMNFFEKKWLAVWKQCLILSWEEFSDVNMDWAVNARVHIQAA